MNRPLALLFAMIGTALLVGIAAAMSYRSGIGVLLFSIGAVAFIGFGFTLKARMRRRNDKKPQP